MSVIGKNKGTSEPVRKKLEVEVQPVVIAPISTDTSKAKSPPAVLFPVKDWVGESIATKKSGPPKIFYQFEKIKQDLISNFSLKELRQQLNVLSRDQIESHPNINKRLKGFQTLMALSLQILSKTQPQWHTDETDQKALIDTLNSWLHNLQSPAVSPSKAAHDLIQIMKGVRPLANNPLIKKFLDQEIQSAVTQVYDNLIRSPKKNNLASFAVLQKAFGLCFWSWRFGSGHHNSPRS